MNRFVRIFLILSVALPSAFLFDSRVSAQEGTNDALEIATTLSELGASDEAAGQAYWDSLSPDDQAAVAELMSDVTIYCGSRSR